jgi:uncharacterized protein DUF6350
MTQVLTSRDRPRPDDVRRDTPVDAAALVGTGVLAAAMAAGAALLVITLVVLVTWAGSPASSASASAALRTVGQLWLLAHRVGIEVPGGHVAIAPLGLLALPGYALFRAGTWLAHTAGITDVRRAVAAGGVVGGAYALVGAIVATLATTPTVHPSPRQALLATGLIGMLFATAGTLRGAELGEVVRALVPPRAQSVLVGAGTALAGVLAVGALLALGALLLHPGRVFAVGRSLHPGTVGGIALALACLAYLPNAVLWGSAFAVGPGFAVGAHTSVSPLGVHLGALPAFPLLGALPSNGSAPGLAVPMLVVPLLAGAAGGVLLIRRLPALRIEEAAAWGFVAGALGGLGLAVLAAVSGGPAGPGRLATVGPSAWQVGLAAALELGLAAAVAAVVAQRRVVTGHY